MSDPMPHSETTIPAGFKFDPDVLEPYDEQLEGARKVAAYQAAPIPGFENVPTVDATPSFNPTGAPDDEIYVRDRVPDRLRHVMLPRSEWIAQGKAEDGPVEMWRIVERTKLEDGTGLVSSSVLQAGTVGDVESFSRVNHSGTNHEGRMSSAEAATPFVSFSTDPIYLARTMIAGYGFGVSGGRESVVVRAVVDPGRVLTTPNKKDHEVLLMGGLAPEEYVAAYGVEDFVRNLTEPDTEIRTPHNDIVTPATYIGYWALHN